MYLFLLASPSDGDLSNAGFEYKDMHFLEYPFIVFQFSRKETMGRYLQNFVTRNIFITQLSAVCVYYCPDGIHDFLFYTNLDIRFFLLNAVCV